MYTNQRKQISNYESEIIELGDIIHKGEFRL